MALFANQLNSVKTSHSTQIFVWFSWPSKVAIYASAIGEHLYLKARLYDRDMLPPNAFGIAVAAAIDISNPQLSQ